MPRECGRLVKVQPLAQAIGEFIEWLREEKGWVLCEEHHHDDNCLVRVPRFEGDEEGDMQLDCGLGEGELSLVCFSLERLLAEFFEIDLDKVEAEKDELLEDLRRHNAEDEHA